MFSELIIEKAKPEYAGDIASLYDLVYEGSYPTINFTIPSEIQKIIQDKTVSWVIARNGDKVVGSAVTEVDVANNSACLCRIVVDPLFREKGIAKKITCMSLENAQAEHKIDLLYCEARNKSIFNLAKQSLDMTLVGYSPGSHLFKDRELHLKTLRLYENARQERVAADSPLYRIPSIEGMITSMELQQVTEPYPDEIIIESPCQQLITVKGYYNNHDLSFTLTPEIGKQLPAVEYLEATVLVDKIAEIRALQKLGFSISCFLPGWFRKNEKRYDCVVLSNPLKDPVVLEHAFFTEVENLMRDFRGRI